MNETVVGSAFCTKPRKTWTWRVQKDKPQKITVPLITVKLLRHEDTTELGFRASY